MKKLLLIALLLAPTGVVRAQEYIPPPIIAPPPYQPFNFQLDRDLSERGHRKKVAGGVLMGLGSALWAGGEALSLYGVFAAPTRTTVRLCGTDLRYCNETVTDYNWAQIGGGIAMAFVGAALTLAGIPVYAVGGSQMKRARFRVTASDVRVEF